MAPSKLRCLLYAACIIMMCSTISVLGSMEEENVLADIFANYSREVLPNKAWKDSVTVRLGLSLIKLHQVNEKYNSITVMTWLEMNFFDYRLKWDPDRYDGLNKLRVPFEKLWLPDIVIFNGLSGARISNEKADAVVTSDGNVRATPPMLITASCEMDLALFPYDIQSCFLKFASWTTSASVIDLQLLRGDKITTTSYSQNSDWELFNSSLARNEKTYCCPSDQYVDITATLEIARRDGPYTVKLVIPSVLTAFLILFTFILPSSSGEKIVFCLLLLLSVLLLLDNIQIAVPANSESVLGEFLTFALFLDFFATIIAVVCYNIADALMGGNVSKKERAERNRKLKMLRIAEFVFFFLFLFIFIIGTAVILSRRG